MRIVILGSIPNVSINKLNNYIIKINGLWISFFLFFFFYYLFLFKINKNKKKEIHYKKKKNNKPKKAREAQLVERRAEAV